MDTGTAMARKRELSRGCILCHRGGKMVLFVTGLCPRTCWYCPLSAERKGHDVIYANERLIQTPDDAEAVARLMSALGTGITGGEPLAVIDRVITFSRHLKQVFGNSHHIHLYTGKAPDEDTLRDLRGLVDEIRMHPPHEIWGRVAESPYRTSAVLAREMGFSIGVEVPSLPGIGTLSSILPYLDFLNINELEWGETNAAAMRDRNMVLEDGIHNAVRGGRGWAGDLLHHPGVHWCSSSFKDSVQLKKRLLRVARNTARPFDQVTRDGTILYGVFKGVGTVLPPFFDQLDPGMYELKDGAVETAWWVITEFSDKMPGEKVIIERYPDRGLIVEVTPVA